jgi:hypothetical protein
MTNVELDTDAAEASTSDRDDAVPVVESRKAGSLTWGEDSPRGGRVVMNRALREDATVPLFLAQTLIQSLRDVGYDSTISALCEHVDNAIGAGAKNIRVYIRQTGRGSSVRTDIGVLDDGDGMSPQILKVATSFGGSTNYNNRSGIGRFGMGMKTAGLSMAPAIQILSWQDRGVYYRMTLDTEAIGRDKSNLIILPEPTLQEDIGADLVQLLTVPMRYPSDASDQRLLAPRGSDLTDALGASGTIIYMPDCDRLSAKRDRTLVDHATKDFAHVYRRHIARGLKIYVNNRLLEAVDPTYSMENARHTRHPALSEVGAKTSRLIVKRKCSIFLHSSSPVAHDVTIKLYALPIRDWRFTRKALDDIGIFQDQTISVLRNDREVFLGHLTALLKRHSDLAWLRIEIDFPGELDEAFGVASNKQGVRLREDVIDGIWKVIKDDVAVVREDIRDVQARNAIKRRDGGGPSTAESKANEADPFQAHSLDDNLTDTERADIEKNLRALAIGLRREGESEEDAFTRIQASKYVLHYKSDRFWPFYEVEHRYGRVILTINTAHPFYDRLYRPLAELALKPTTDGGEEEVTTPESESPLAVVLDLLLLSLARTQSVMSASKETRPAGELFEDMRREWSDTLKKQMAA